MGFTICATSGTAASVREAVLEVAVEVAKLGDVDGVNAVDLINAGDVKLVVNSPRGRGPRADGDHIGRLPAGRVCHCSPPELRLAAAKACRTGRPTSSRFEACRSTTRVSQRARAERWWGVELMDLAPRSGQLLSVRR